MSTFILDNEHIHVLIAAAGLYGDGPIIDLNCNGRWVTFDRDELGELGRLLKATNVSSHARSSIAVDAVAYTYRSPQVVREPVEVLKAIDCYEYQACEAPGWESSVAKAFCQWLRRQTIAHLPGYEDADWGIDSPVSVA